MYCRIEAPMNRAWASALLMVAFSSVSDAQEIIFREVFEEAQAKAPFRQGYGDKPIRVEANALVPKLGQAGSAGAQLRLVFGPKAEKNLSYWYYDLREPVPIFPQLGEISLDVKANVPVLLKIAIAPFGFIYHSKGCRGTGQWETLRLEKACDELRRWCARGDRDARYGYVCAVIVAVAKTKDVTADIAIDNITFAGPAGAKATARNEIRRRQAEAIRVSVVSQMWSDEGRTLEKVLECIELAAFAGADIVAMPQECVKSTGEPIPGPISTAIAAAAKQHQLYVIGSIRELDAGKTYVTSFLCDREGKLVGKYRKSHKMPDEDMDLGDELPVFKTGFGPIAMRIGTDRFFPDIDHVYTAQGARIIFWAQMPEPVEDEFGQDFPSAGRAVDYGVVIACSRYAYAKEGWITNKYPPYCGCPIGRAYVINRDGQRVASTSRKGGLATAAIALRDLRGGRGPNRKAAFAALTEPIKPLSKKQYAKRRVRIAIIEPHGGFNTLLQELDNAGKIGSDIVCLYEYVWISGGKPERVAAMTQNAKAQLALLAAKAKQWKMYVLVAGVVDRLERNEAIVYGRDGSEVGRYFKIAKTHDEMISGDATPIIETDFGRIGVRICADEHMVELDRCYGIKGADIIFTPTQSWGPDAIFRDLRDISRAMDNHLFHVQCTHSGTEVRHRSMIVEPTGCVVAKAKYRRPGLVTAVVDLDNDRPLRYVRKYEAYKPHGYLPQYQPDRMPASANDLRETVYAQRRPELYQVLAPKENRE